MDAQKSSEQQTRMKATLVLVAIVSFIIFGVLKQKDNGPDTRAHIALEDLKRTSPEAIFPLLNYYPRDGVDIHDQFLLDRLTDHIVENIVGASRKNTHDKIKEMAKYRAKSLILASLVCGVPLSELTAKAHGESHFCSKGVAPLTNNMFNLGNTDDGSRRTFADIELGSLCAATNLAGRMYEYFRMFPERDEIDFYAVYMNRDPITGIGFLKHQLNYGVENPLRDAGTHSPFGAYATNALAITQTEKLRQKLLFIDRDKDQVEIVRDITEGVIYYEKSIPHYREIYHVFSYVSTGVEAVGHVRTSLAGKLGVKPSEVTILPYDQSWYPAKNENLVVPPSSTLLYMLYRSFPTQ